MLLLNVPSSVRPRPMLLALAGGLTSAVWVYLAIRIPATYWTNQPFPVARIRDSYWSIGPLNEGMLLLALLALGYLLLVWVVESSEHDLSARVVYPIAALSGVAGLFTYALFAEDVNYLLGNLWTFSVAGENPYETSIDDVPKNPYSAFTTWTHLEYLYGPALLPVGWLVVWATGSNPVLGVLAIKLTLLNTLAVAGATMGRLARAMGSRKPHGMAALLLWNPLVIAESVMTPHLDLVMATLVLLACLMWMRQRLGATLLCLALSVGVKLVTLLVLPAVLFGLLMSMHQRRWHGLSPLLVVLSAVGGVGLALWPHVWEPLLENGISKELGFDTIGALLPALFSLASQMGIVEPPRGQDVWSMAHDWRWRLFPPFWLASLALSGWVAWRHRPALPAALVPTLAITLLGYHLLFSLVVMPWHFMTVLFLALAVGTRAARLGAVLITLSGLIYHLHDHWVWRYFGDDPERIALVMAPALLTGPMVALALLLLETRHRHLASGTGGAHGQKPPVGDRSAAGLLRQSPAEPRPHPAGSAM